MNTSDQTLQQSMQTLIDINLKLVWWFPLACGLGIGCEWLEFHAILCSSSSACIDYFYCLKGGIHTFPTHSLGIILYHSFLMCVMTSIIIITLHEYNKLSVSTCNSLLVLLALQFHNKHARGSLTMHCRCEWHTCMHVPLGCTSDVKYVI